MPKLDPEELRNAADETARRAALSDDPLEQLRGAMAAKNAWELADSIDAKEEKKGKK